MSIQDFYNNRINNCHNLYQGKYPRVLAVCSAGLLRSATMAWVLGQEPYNCNVRAVGVEASYALIAIDQVLIDWADHIVFAMQEHKDIVGGEFALRGVDGNNKRTWVLGIPDRYGYRDPKLVGIIRDSVKTVGLEEELRK